MKIDLLLQGKRSVPMGKLLEALEVSQATIKRDLEYLRDRMHAPIIWGRMVRGYRYELSDEDTSNFSLPGLWFNSSEVHALLTMDHLLSNMQSRLLGPHIEPLRHLRNELQSFAVDVITHIESLEKKAKNISQKALNEVCRAGYGIFSGNKTHKAVPKFTPERARWVANESWHSEQPSRFDLDGSYILTIPHSNYTELVLDIVRYGPDVEVISLKSLRDRVADLLRAANEQYKKRPDDGG